MLLQSLAKHIESHIYYLFFFLSQVLTFYNGDGFREGEHPFFSIKL